MSNRCNHDPVRVVGRQPLFALLRTLSPGMAPGWLVGWALNSLVGLLFVPFVVRVRT